MMPSDDARQKIVQSVRHFELMSSIEELAMLFYLKGVVVIWHVLGHAYSYFYLGAPRF